jgi:signal transduction histidine kinase
MKTSIRYIWVVPFLSAGIGVAVLFLGYWERDKGIGDVERLFTRHVETVASLVTEGARTAADATSLMYDLTEEHLLTTVHLFAVLYDSGLEYPDLLAEEEWRTKLIVKADGTVVGDFGPIAESDRTEFIKSILEANEAEMIEDGLVGRYKLLCLYHTVRADRAIICRSAEKLEELRRKTGIGALMKGVVQRGVLYVALQDESGILAAAPSTQYLSDWTEDPPLKEALKATKNARVSRTREVSGYYVFEGLVPFEMADGTTALLRIGVDATLLQTIRANSYRRFTIMVGLVVSIVLLITFMSWLFWLWRINQLQTERVLAEQEADRKHWEAFGQMAATVAHEIRSPLNTLSMVSQRLPREFSIPEQEREEFNGLVSLLRSESERVNRVVTDFLQIGKPITLHVESIDAEQAVREAVMPMQIRADQESVTLEIDNRCDRVIELDKDRFRQIMLNLVGNALDAISPNVGKVVVRSECRADGLYVEIEDNGPGMDNEKIEQVLQPFVSFKSKGTGLGLPLVKRLVEAHGGRFELFSIPGKGTTAKLFIPKQQVFRPQTSRRPIRP